MLTSLSMRLLHQLVTIAKREERSSDRSVIGTEWTSGGFNAGQPQLERGRNLTSSLGTVIGCTEAIMV